MKRTDKLRLEKREIRNDYKNSVLALMVEITLFAVILVLLTFTAELDGLFDRYCKRELPDCYSVTVKNIGKEDVDELGKDGIRHLELYPSEDGEPGYEATGTFDSFVRFDRTKIKWRLRGVTIVADELEDFVDILIFIKEIFICLSVIGIILCVLAVCGLYSMRVEGRAEYSHMLMRLGMRERTVKGLFFSPFLGMDIISIIIAYGIAKGVLGYFNRLIREGFGDLELSGEGLEITAVFVLAVSVLLMVFTFGRRWSRKAGRAGINAKIIIGLSTVILLLFCVGVYQQIFDRQIHEISTENKKDCYLEEVKEVKSYEEYKRIGAEALSRGKTLGTEEVSAFFSVGMTDGTSKKTIDEIPRIHNAVLFIDGKRYPGTEDWRAGIHPTNEYHKTDAVEVGIYDAGFTLFPQNVISQYREETGRESCLIGRLPTAEGEILLSNYLLEKFGIGEEEQASLPGKRVSLYLGDKGNVTYCKNYTLSGIFDAAVLKVREKNGTRKCMEQALIHFTGSDSKKLAFVQAGTIRYYAGDFNQLEAARRMSAGLSEKPEVSVYGVVYGQMDRQISVINRILRLVIAGFVLAVSVYLLSIFYFFFRYRQNYLVMLLAIGLRDSGLYRILFSEILGFVFCSLILGVYVSLYILFGLKYVYENAMLFPFSPDASILCSSGLWAALYCLLLFLLAGVYYCRRLTSSAWLRQLSAFDAQKSGAEGVRK